MGISTGKNTDKRIISKVVAFSLDRNLSSDFSHFNMTEQTLNGVELLLCMLTIHYQTGSNHRLLESV